MQLQHDPATTRPEKEPLFQQSLKTQHLRTTALYRGQSRPGLPVSSIYVLAMHTHDQAFI